MVLTIKQGQTSKQWQSIVIDSKYWLLRKHRGCLEEKSMYSTSKPVKRKKSNFGTIAPSIPITLGLLASCHLCSWVWQCSCVYCLYINIPVLFPALLLVLMDYGPHQLWLSALLYTWLFSILWQVSFWALQVMHWPSSVLWETYAQPFKPDEAACFLNEFREAPR